MSSSEMKEVDHATMVGRLSPIPRNLRHSSSKTSLAGSDTTYHSFHDIELYEAPGPPSLRPKQRPGSKSGRDAADVAGSPPETFEMQRQDSGYESLPRRASQSSRHRRSSATSASVPSKWQQKQQQQPKRRPSARSASRSSPGPSSTYHGHNQQVARTGGGGKALVYAGAGRQYSRAAYNQPAAVLVPASVTSSFFHFPAPDVVSAPTAAALTAAAQGQVQGQGQYASSSPYAAADSADSYYPHHHHHHDDEGVALASVSSAPGARGSSSSLLPAASGYHHHDFPSQQLQISPPTHPHQPCPSSYTGTGPSHPHPHGTEGQLQQQEHPLPPATTHYWTSDRTRRLEYAAIDAASRGVKGWVLRHVVPDCFVPRESRERRWTDFDDETGSVRRYRLDLDGNGCGNGSTSPDGRHRGRRQLGREEGDDEGRGENEAHLHAQGHRRGGWRLWGGRS